MREKIVLGLSGGVDSAVAARLLQERYEVTGLYLDIGLAISLISTVPLFRQPQASSA